jgi:hypothetical protein
MYRFKYLKNALDIIRNHLAKVYFKHLKYEELEVHFFTIVVNGMPFIKWHINIFNQMKLKWHWHIVEGIAEHRKDTAWSLKYGAKIIDDMHKSGLSTDGTSEYLDELSLSYPHNIHVYRPYNEKFWNGKVEMCNVFLNRLPDTCLLWQIDVDEFWDSGQIETVHELFIKKPHKTTAWFFCNFFVGPDLMITSKDTYGNYSHYEWIRVWRFHRGMFWLRHEPPTLCINTILGPCDIANIDPISHDETESLGLRFDHYAYVLPEQLRFKEKYYGLKNALEYWLKLQNQTEFPVLLKNYFPWVRDDAIVEKRTPKSINQNSYAGQHLRTMKVE